jgi:hypothetical protein
MSAYFFEVYSVTLGIVAVKRISQIVAFPENLFDGSRLVYVVLTAYFKHRKYDSGVSHSQTLFLVLLYVIIYGIISI